MRRCGTSADYGLACWPAADQRYVLCDRDPYGRTVDRLAVNWSNGAAVAAPFAAVPFILVLDDGTRCSIRDGGVVSHAVRVAVFLGSSA